MKQDIQIILNNLGFSIERLFNKVYCRDINSILNKVANSNIDLTPSEKQALNYLIYDLNQLKFKTK
jgi:hypothetical protein